MALRRSLVATRRLMPSPRDCPGCCRTTGGGLPENGDAPSCAIPSPPIGQSTCIWRLTARSSKEGNGRRGFSIEPEHRGKPHDDDRGPDGVCRQIGGLPALKAGKGAAAAEKTEVEHGRPPEVPEQNHVLAQRG